MEIIILREQTCIYLKLTSIFHKRDCFGYLFTLGALLSVHVETTDTRYEVNWNQLPPSLEARTGMCTTQARLTIIFSTESLTTGFSFTNSQVKQLNASKSCIALWEISL